MLEDPTGDLAQILLYHVVGSKVMAADLVNGQSVSTLNGKRITIPNRKASFSVNNAKILVVGIMADNGVVHVIDAVIIPSAATTNIVDGYSADKLAKVVN